MEIKHYNAIAKILGGNLLGDNKLEMLINSLSKYFEEEDESFNKHEFRAACLNGYNMEESLERVKKVDAQLNDEEMNWVMMLLILPKIKNMVRTSDDFKDFKAMKKASVH